jgi:predicted nucleotidyltransferase
MNDQIIQIVLTHYPQTQAIYLFGSYAVGQQNADSDVDIALLLPPNDAKQAGTLALSSLHLSLADQLGREIDLVNLRLVTSVFQKEIITKGQRIFCTDAYAADEFEMLVLSFYQKLNEERRGILEAFAQTGRAYPV